MNVNVERKPVDEIKEIDIVRTCTVCNKTTCMKFKITPRNLEKVMNDDPWTQEALLFYLRCPECQRSFAVKPNDLKQMILKAQEEV